LGAFRAARVLVVRSRGVEAFVAAVFAVSVGVVEDGAALAGVVVAGVLAIVVFTLSL
jgi:hypothetical protein